MRGVAVLIFHGGKLHFLGPDLRFLARLKGRFRAKDSKIIAAVPIY